MWRNLKCSNTLEVLFIVIQNVYRELANWFMIIRTTCLFSKSVIKYWREHALNEI